MWTFKKVTSECTISLTGRLFSNAAEGVREAVLSNLGLTVSSQWMFAPKLASGGLTVLSDWSLPTMDLWLVTPTGRQACAKAKCFASFFEGRLGIDAEPVNSILE